MIGSAPLVMRSSRQDILNRRVADSICASPLTLDMLQERTGINRSKLGRIRLCSTTVSIDEAERIFRATGFPGRAFALLAFMGETFSINAEALSYVDQFLSHLPNFALALNDFGSDLNPKWANGSLHKLLSILKEHVEQRKGADLFD